MVPGLRLIGTAQEKTSVLSFVLDGYRTEDVGAALDREGIAHRLRGRGGSYPSA
jgi:cysteine desulfurase/selenocysteine lyase